MLFDGASNAIFGVSQWMVVANLGDYKVGLDDGPFGYAQSRRIVLWYAANNLGEAIWVW